ncbi:putative pseudouridylate synthase I [Trypanosoma conorhini]|uniref:Putative pseudouridylate synthase I n=1 Tax=Trypanosoma conorhini TaxID=83891 RepID=A0A422QBI9_9TRYP|nr:putative pseudouridylate synthase I [Trypanosoma conorhini]RNF27266.1 putative pseudouridylate synthase I [Trypanosoma conorhini]
MGVSGWAFRGDVEAQCGATPVTSPFSLLQWEEGFIPSKDEQQPAWGAEHQQLQYEGRDREVAWAGVGGQGKGSSGGKRTKVQMARRNAFEGRRMCLRKAPKDHTLLGLCIMYCGTGYRGLQLQTHAPTHHTVEGVLIQALKDVGLVEAIERGRVQGDMHHFARSCRTDRGVHAVRNIVCLFVPTERLEALGGCDKLKEALNTKLPLTIRLARVTPLMGNFIPRFSCNRRVYHYLIPAYALVAPCDQWTSFFEKFPQAAESLQRCSKDGRSSWDFSPAESEPWAAALSAAVTRGNELLLRFLVGTHRFHSFSVDASQRGGSAWNRKVISPCSNEAVRSVYRCEIAPRVFLLPQATTGLTRAEFQAALQTVMEDASLASSLPPLLAAAAAADAASVNSVPADVPLPFVVLQIEGNSFLFNMIRKIVGTLIAILRGARETLFAEALSPDRRVVCPLAPGPYLYLFLSTYRRYDTGVRGSRSARFRPIAEEWRGDVAAAATAFAHSAVAADVVDLDLNRTPAIGTLLAARDLARRATRPCWEAEDCHLAALKEHRPAAVEPHPPRSEMTAFLRSLRVHNWSIEAVKCPATAPAKKGGREQKPPGKEEERTQKTNKRPREAQEAGAAAEEGGLQNVQQPCVEARGDGSGESPALQATPNSGEAHVERKPMPNNSGRGDDGKEEEEDDDDGWIYVAATEAAARSKRREYHQRRRQRARAWEHNEPAREGAVNDWDSEGGGSE